jgi:hypothetical protein
MKQELVRTKSKISSLKREMSSIQQLHLAQQQVHAQLSAPTSISPRQDSHHHHHLHPNDQSNHFYLQQSSSITDDLKNLSISNNDESSLSSPPFNITNTSSSTQTPPLNKFRNTNDQHTRRATSSSIHVDSSTAPSDEQLRLYLTETLQREKDSAV